VIDLETLRIAFQIRPGLIERTTFTGAFQALLNQASEFARWRVDPEFSFMPWPVWVERVDRIARLEIALERPNPNYWGRNNVEALIEGAEARMLRMVYEALEDDLDGLEVDDPFIMEAIEHADQGYGEWKAVGETEIEGETHRTQWRSDSQGVAPERRVEADPETGEAPPEEIRRELREHPPEEVEGAADESSHS
jgi:hypothetical protein